MVAMGRSERGSGKRLGKREERTFQAKEKAQSQMTNSLMCPANTKAYVKAINL